MNLIKLNKKIKSNLTHEDYPYKYMDKKVNKYKFKFIYYTNIYEKFTKNEEIINSWKNIIIIPNSLTKSLNALRNFIKINFINLNIEFIDIKSFKTLDSLTTFLYKKKSKLIYKINFRENIRKNLWELEIISSKPLIKEIKILENNAKIFFKNILNYYNSDIELKKHCERVSEYTEILCNLMLIQTDIRDKLKEGALLHDIGKLFIRKLLLNKSSKLSLNEFEEIKKHPNFGIEILKNENLSRTVENIILYHHEKWNGKGYPLSLQGVNIPIEARIISIVDCYDALTSKRVYKNQFSHIEALNILKSESGKSFDPYIVHIFLSSEKIFKEKLEILHAHKK